jgi:hypothetical protein
MTHLKIQILVCSSYKKIHYTSIYTEPAFVGLSLEELGMRALQKLPRERQIDGIRAFNSMR